jgi:hypothetical protein
MMPSQPSLIYPVVLHRGMLGYQVSAFDWTEEARTNTLAYLFHLGSDEEKDVDNVETCRGFVGIKTGNLGDL